MGEEEVKNRNLWTALYDAAQEAETMRKKSLQLIFSKQAVSIVSLFPGYHVDSPASALSLPQRSHQRQLRSSTLLMRIQRLMSKLPSSEFRDGMITNLDHKLQPPLIGHFVK